jgi:hypothetical protein
LSENVLDTRIILPTTDSEGNAVTYINDNAFKDNINITDVIMPNTI